MANVRANAAAARSCAAQCIVVLDCRNEAAIGQVFGVNARMMPALNPATVTVIQMDNSHTGWFWTKYNIPIRESRYPPMPMPTAEDWR